MNTVRSKTWLGVWIFVLGLLFVSVLVMMPSSTAAQTEENFRDQTLPVLNGAYGLKIEGTFIDPDERVPFTMLGQIIVDGQGNITQGVRTLNFAGAVEQDTVTGTYLVNADGTGSIVLNGFEGDTQVAVEEFDCFFIRTGNQFECTITRIARVDNDPPLEFPVVGLATGLRQ